MLRQAQKPSDSKWINHDGGAGTPRQFTDLHLDTAAIRQEIKRVNQLIACGEIDTQFNGMSIRIGISLRFYHRAKRFSVPEQFGMKISSITVQNMIAKF